MSAIGTNGPNYQGRYEILQLRFLNMLVHIIRYWSWLTNGRTPPPLCYT